MVEAHLALRARRRCWLLCLWAVQRAQSLKIVIAGGTGGLGSVVASKVAGAGHDVTILCRNAFLAQTPSRVSEDFGWVGERRVDRWAAAGARLTFRDWTGGDELDCVSDRWVGWEASVAGADALVFAAGDYGRDGRRRPIDALGAAAVEAGGAAPRRYVHLAPADALVATTGAYADRKRETLLACEARWRALFGKNGVCLRAGTVLGLPRFAESRLWPPPKRVRDSLRDWVHVDDLAAAVVRACEGGLDGDAFVSPDRRDRDADAGAAAPLDYAFPTLDAARGQPAPSPYYEV